jgi:hypothetical protein
MPDGLTLNKITSQKGVSIGEAARRVADLGWTPSYVRESMSFPTDYKITKAPKDPMKQVSVVRGKGYVDPGSRPWLHDPEPADQSARNDAGTARPAHCGLPQGLHGAPDLITAS